MKRRSTILLLLSSVVVAAVYCNLWKTQKQYLPRFYYSYYDDTNDTTNTVTATAAATTTTTSVSSSSLLLSLFSSTLIKDSVNMNDVFDNDDNGSNSGAPPLREGGRKTPTTRNNNKHKRKIKTAICLIQKGQLYDLEEWIDYHLLALDFDTIYIYDNSDEFELENYTLKYLRPLTEKNLIITHLPGYKQQMNAYQKCVESQRYYYDDGKSMAHYHHDWLAFWDSDEFLVLRGKHSTIGELLLDIAYNNNNGDGDGDDNDNDDNDFDVNSNIIDGLAFNRIWFYFFNTTTENVTTSYYHQLHFNYEPGLPVLRKFQYRVKVPDPYVKTIAKVSTIIGSHPHYPKYKKNNKKNHVDTNRKDLGTSKHINRRRPEDIAVLYHYETKSLEEYQSKCTRGAATSGKHKLACESIDKIFEYFLYNRTLQNGGLIKDDTAYKFLVDKLPNKYGTNMD